MKNMLLGICFSLLLWSLFLSHFVEEDFTDTGVGCIDACLEPLEE